MDQKRIVRQLLLRSVDWITLSPFLGGVAIGLGAWAVGRHTGIATAACVSLMLISVGIYLNRLLFGWQENYERIVTAWRESVEKAREAELDHLYGKLSKDGDPRTETLLKDLRTLTRALMSEQSGSLAMDAFDIVADVDKLFQRSVAYLRESLTLWEMAENMGRASIKAQLLKQREVLISEVEKSLENLGDVLGRVKRAAVHSADGQAMVDLREELSARLKIAEDVEEKMKAMRMGVTVSAQEDEKYLQYAKP